jgi:hypothetical protein
MKAVLERVLPEAHAQGRLMHTAPTHYVFDVASRSIPPSRRAAFLAAAAEHPRVSRVLGPADGELDVVHIEIPRAAGEPHPAAGDGKKLETNRRGL